MSPPVVCIAVWLASSVGFLFGYLTHGLFTGDHREH